jgi:hypothetical protein
MASYAIEDCKKLGMQMLNHFNEQVVSEINRFQGACSEVYRICKGRAFPSKYDTACSNIQCRIDELSGKIHTYTNALNTGIWDGKPMDVKDYNVLFQINILGSDITDELNNLHILIENARGTLHERPQSLPPVQETKPPLQKSRISPRTKMILIIIAIIVILIIIISVVLIFVYKAERFHFKPAWQ